MTTPLEDMATAAITAVGNALNAVGSARNAIVSARASEARGLVYTAKLRLEVARSILSAIDLALDMEERNHGTLR
jgi:hypothetical protein